MTMERCFRSALVVSLLLAGALTAAATPVHYTFNFTTISGGPNPTGSFDYDANATPPNWFSNFIVNWDGLAFDFTSLANTPGGIPNLPCFPSADGAGTFSALANPGSCGTGQTLWIAKLTSQTAIFRFTSGWTSPPDPPLTDLLLSSEFSVQGVPPTQAQGGWTVNAVAEPYTIGTLAIGLLFLAASKRLRAPGRRRLPR